jgi:hypothetical protein
MGVRVMVEISGLDEVLKNLEDIQVRSPENLVKLTAELARDTEQEWKAATPRRTGRLQEADVAQPDGLTFQLLNSTYYYRFLDAGHWTPRGWRTRHGFRPAKRRSFVEGRHMTSKAVEFVEGNITDYLARFLDM